LDFIPNIIGKVTCWSKVSGVGLFTRIPAKFSLFFSKVSSQGLALGLAAWANGRWAALAGHTIGQRGCVDDAGQDGYRVPGVVTLPSGNSGHTVIHIRTRSTARREVTTATPTTQTTMTLDMLRL
jgi:hypothetical protein